MSQQEEIVLWIDQRWKRAIEKHLNDETLQEHLENVLDELCNQLPEREYERISRAIQSEAAAQRAEEEAARTYAAYHVTERGQEWYFKTSPGEELLTVGKKLRSYITSEKAAVPDKFIGMFFGGQPITAKEFDALTALRMENTGKVRGVFDVNFDKCEFSAVHIMDGWQTWAMRDVSVAVYHATRSQFASGDDINIQKCGSKGRFPCRFQKCLAAFVFQNIRLHISPVKLLLQPVFQQCTFRSKIIHNRNSHAGFSPCA